MKKRTALCWAAILRRLRGDSDGAAINRVLLIILAACVAFTLLTFTAIKVRAACSDYFQEEEIQLPFVCTDANDYHPGTTVTIFGHGFEVGETVELQVMHADDSMWSEEAAGEPLNDNHLPWLVTVDANGEFVTTWQVDDTDSIDRLLRLTAYGLTSSMYTEVVFSDDLSPAATLTAACGSYAQNFDALVASGTGTTTPQGWGFSEAGGNTIYTAGTGSGNAGDTYSYGVAGANPVTDRALGSLLSGSVTPTIGAVFANNTGGTITALKIRYMGEQWRLGATAREDRLDFQINQNGSSLTAGTFTDVDALDFVAPVTAGTVGALDGNANANRTLKTATITGLSIPNGQSFVIRWLEFNATGADDGLGVDDFTLIPLTTSITVQPTDQTACIGSPATFTVSATGGTVANWRKRGSGWGGGWTIIDGNGGHFVGSSTGNNSGDAASNGGVDITTGGRAWGMFHNAGGAVTEALRPFGSSMAVGETFSIDMDNGNVDTGVSVGFGLQNAASGNRFEIFFTGGNANYSVSGSGGTIDSGIPFTRSGINVRFTLTGVNSYSVTITRYPSSLRAGQAVTITGTLKGTAGDPINQLRLFDNNQGGGGAKDLFFNNIGFDGRDDNAGNSPYTSWDTGDNGGQSPLVNGGSISGANTTTLTINPVTAGDAGAYDVVVGDCQETVSATVNLTIVNTPPSVTCPGATNVSANANCQGVVPDVASSAVATGVCTPITITQSPTAGTLVGLGNTTITVTATDASGNQATCTTTLTVQDTTGPTIVCPTFPARPTDANCQATVPNMMNVADAVLDFSGTQGDGGWFYGSETAFSSASFVQLPHYDGTKWYGDGCFGTPYVTISHAHPGVGGCDGFSSFRWAVRRYVAEASGTFRVKGVFGDGDLGCNSGDGVKIRIRKNNTDLNFNVVGCCTVPDWQINPGDTPNRDYWFDVTLAVGDTLDFCVDPLFDSGCDDTFFTANVRPLVTDNCGIAQPPASPALTQVPAPGTIISGPTTVTLTATDNAGNTGSCVSSLTIQDSTPPTANCQSIVKALSGGSATVNASEIDNGSSDNCGGVTLAIRKGASGAFGASVSYSCTNVGPNTVQLLVTDGSGNSATCTASVAVQDNTPPTITCPGPVGVQCFSAVPAADFAGGSASDDCGTPTVAHVGDSQSNPGSSCNNVITRTYRATDASGNTADCTQTITVNDDTAPVITCPADTSVQCNGDTSPAATGTATVNDNCGGSITPTYADAAIAPVANVTVVAWNFPNNPDNATADAGIAANLTKTISVVGGVNAPTFVPAAGAATSTARADGWQSGANAKAWQVSFVTTGYNNLRVSSKQRGSSTGPRDFKLQYSLNGTSWTDVANVPAVADNFTSGVLVSQVLPAAVNNQATVFLRWIMTSNVSVGGGTVASGGAANIDDIVVVGDSSATGISRTWTATDACGNSASCVQTITTVDTAAPVLSGCPANASFQCYNSVPAAATVTALDGCDGAVAVSFSETESNPGSSCNNTITRTWSATDSSGNAASCSQTITVNDNTAPDVDVPSDAAVECDASTAPAALGTATAEDNCTAAPTVTFSDSTAAGSCANSLVITRTWTATDDCGNSSSANQIITVQDTTAPVVVAPADATVECGDSTSPSATGSATATDNCDPLSGATVVTLANVNFTGFAATGFSPTPGAGQLDSDVWSVTGFTDGSVAFGGSGGSGTDFGRGTSTGDVGTGGIYAFNVGGGNIALGVQPAGSDFNPGTEVFRDIVNGTGGTITSLAVSYTIYIRNNEGRGNSFNFSHSASGVATSFINEASLDFVSPAAADASPAWVAVNRSITLAVSIPPGGIYYLRWTGADVNGSGNRDEFALDDILVTTTVSSPETVNHSDTETAGCGNTKTITRTWSITDACGNTGSAVQTITVQDTIAPALIGVPADTSASCDAIPAAATVTANDACDASPSVTLDEQTTAGSCANSYTIVRTWTATDACGNSSSASQSITVQDTTAPTLVDVPGDADAVCDSVPTAATVTATDNCDGSPSVTLDEQTTAGSCANSYTIVRTWTATDACGNSSSASQTINVSDTQAPDLIGVPADATVECDAVPAAATVTAEDNCDASPSVTLDEQTTAGSCANSYTIVRTWTATDACGNSSSASQSITVQDTTAPTLVDVPGDADAVCDSVPTAATVTATDNCDGSPSVTLDEQTTAGSCANSYTIVRTWTATDACGNSSSASQTINVSDTQAPDLIGVPADATVECDAVPAAATVTAEDNCDASPSVTLDEQTTAGSCANSYTIVRTWTATDACGNSSSASQSITVQDTTAPTLVDVPGDADAVCDSVPTAATVTATDNCDGSPSVTLDEQTTAGSCANSYTIVRTWTATDACGNSSSASQTINVSDTQAPDLIGVPADATVECDAVPAAATVTAEDNCDASPSVTLDEQTTAGSCANSYTIVRTWTATDACGNSSSASQSITVQDTTAPTLVDVPGDADAVCDSVPTAATVTATDNCDGSPSVSLDEQTTAGSCANSYTIVRTWTATDACGNSSQASQTINVSDTQAPDLIGVPADATVECDAVPAAATVTAEDNCDASPSVTLDEQTTAGSCANSYTIVRTWTATDACGNSSSASQSITVQDTTAPALSGVPADATVECDAVPAAATVTATDNCDGSPSVSLDEQTTAGSCPGNYTIVRTWTATDACGNSSQASQTINVSDTQAPDLIGVPADATVECDAVPAAATVTAEDNCDASPSVTLDEQTTAGSCANSYAIVRTWTATDACGNSSSASQTITVQDTTAPTLVDVPGDADAVCDSVPAAATVTATDNCDSSPSVTLDEQTTAGSCANSYTIVRTWTATDACGNSSQASQTINVSDTQAPDLVGVPADETVECDAVPAAATVTAEDNCDASPSVTLDEQTTAGSCANSYTIVRTWTATDACGNSSSASQTITVQDTTAPALIGVPADATVECDAVPAAAAVSATDNCDASPSVSLDEQTTAGSCANSYTIVRTWTATDACGNSSSASQTITVEDTTAPALSGVPADTTVACDAIPAPASPTASDNCDSSPTLAYAQATSPGTCPQTYTITRTWTASDACGNSASASQVITVQDAVAPVLSGVPADATVQCDAIPAPASPTASDNCDNSPTVAYAQSTTAGSCPQSYTITRTWTASDACGNSSSASQLITVQDTVAPTLSGLPSDLTIQCGQPVPAAPTVTASDNCDSTVPVSFIQSSAGSCPTVITRTWSAVDDCGNAVSASQTITIEDTIAPTITCPANVSVECTATSTDPSNTGSATATDTCDSSVTVTYSDSGAGTCPATITRTWTATDDCGNSSSCQQTITVNDTTKPVLSGCPEDIVIRPCDAIPAPATVTALDACQGAVTVTYTQQTVTNNSTSGDNNSDDRSSDDNDGCGQHTRNTLILRTWTATDACGNSASCSQVITINIEGNCVFSHGYWKTHSSVWPVTSLTIGCQVKTQSQLLAILNSSNGGDASISLAQQLIAALLNQANGACVNASVQTCINNAMSLLCTKPVGSNPNGTIRTQMNSAASCLDSFNDGKMGNKRCSSSPNHPPVAMDDMDTTQQSTPVIISILDNDVDADGDGLAVLFVTDPGDGELSINANGTITYTPNAGFVGSDSFTYVLSDGRGGYASAVVMVFVQAGVPGPSNGEQCSTEIQSCLARSVVYFGSSGGSSQYATFEGAVTLTEGNLASDFRDNNTTAQGTLKVTVGGNVVYNNLAVPYAVIGALPADNTEKWEFSAGAHEKVTFLWKDSQAYDANRDPSLPNNVGSLFTRFIHAGETEFRFEWKSSTRKPLLIVVDGIVIVKRDASGNVSSALPNSKSGSRIDVVYPGRLVPGNIIAWYNDANPSDGYQNLIYTHNATSDGISADTYFNAGGQFYVSVPVSGVSINAANRSSLVQLSIGEFEATLVGCSDFGADEYNVNNKYKKNKYKKQGSRWNFNDDCDACDD